MRRYLLTILFPVALIALSCNSSVEPSKTVDAEPNIFPDYKGVTVPCNIAPLNFKMNEKCSSVFVSIAGADGNSISVRGKHDVVDIPQKQWKSLMKANEGQSLTFSVVAKIGSEWVGYRPFSVEVSQFPIDENLVYRLIAPGYEVYSKMGIYQRNMTNFEQSAIYENTLLDRSCVNCHSFCQGDPSSMSLHIRGDYGATVLSKDGNTKMLNTKTEKTISSFVYPFWHPSGKFIAYSVNLTQQVFHASNDKIIEVFDTASDVVVYDVENNQTLMTPLLMRTDALETFPCFSPDGRKLYYCSAAGCQLPMEYEDLHYNICSIDFDPETRSFGQIIDTVYNAQEEGLSARFPRFSPDGKLLLFTVSDYGNFSIWQKNADLRMFNMETRTVDSLQNVNSCDTESYHSWSSNGRWFVFSSRRIDGLYTRPYFCYVDEQGCTAKPFLLPQKNPNMYDELFFSYNIPELVKGKVVTNIRDWERMLKNKQRTQVATPK